ncbi:MAG TPA: L-histidine N(alpha)-methyltransferase, partial [Pirellulales bacterium]|nr:L-histidine N(alpha)-methyltransferase [Pirellulales bacterium]
MSSTKRAISGKTRRAVNSPFARDVLAGLSRRPKSLSSMYFYDEKGSRLFQQITELDEYYLTGAEREILQTHCSRLAERLSAGSFRLVELGAGDGRITKVLLRHFVERGLQFEYVPVDICEEAVVGLTDSLRPLAAESKMRVDGMAAEYFEALAALSQREPQPTCVLFLGSNLGNFQPAGARRFLSGVRQTLRPGDRLLIGLDLKKDPEALI